MLAELYVWLAAQRCIRRKTGIGMFSCDSAVKIAAGTLIAGALIFAASRISAFSGGNLISVFLQTAAFAAVYGIAGMAVLLALKEQTALLIAGRITRMFARK